ncbi:MAG: ammonium transporter [Rhodospirillales bacterium]|nr:ammonium transporter [Rhodospirillales bacterium]
MRSLLKPLAPGGLAAVLLPLLTAVAFAQETTVVEETVVAAAPTFSAGDTAWMLTSTALVLMMTIPGLALFYCGMVRKKNQLAMAMQSFAICCLVTILWMIAGYSLTFTDGGALQTYIGGLNRVLLHGMAIDSVNSLAATIPESVFMMFQMTFAIITPALITGAFADRMKFSALMWFMAFWSLLVYVPIAHWVWGGGFLGGAGVLDFAGGTVVHINAGIAGLVTCIVIGRRSGYGSENMAPHNLTLSLIGASLLWVGWFGFNAGSAVTAGPRAGMAMTVTQIATAAAALSWLFTEWVVRGKPSILGIISGAVAGLVAITPASGFVNPTGGLMIGLIAGFICFAASVWLKNALKYDDSLDVWGVHGVGGIVGAILTGVYADPAVGGSDTAGNPIAGLFFGNAAQVWTQVEGVIVTIVYCAVVSFILLKIIDLIIGLRVTQEQEVAGLDLSLHGEILH